MHSKKLKERICNPRNAGSFRIVDAERTGLRLVKAEAGSLEKERMICFYFLVNEEDGCFVEAKFQLFGPPQLIGVSDVICELVLKKNYRQISKFSAEFIERSCQESLESGLVNLLLEALEVAIEQCQDIALIDEAPPSPISEQMESAQVVPDWELLSKEQKLELIRILVRDEIQPYIELDAGGVKVLDLRDDWEIILAYEGSCTSCYSATGATLNAIDQMIKGKIHPNLFVSADPSFLKQE